MTIEVFNVISIILYLPKCTQTLITEVRSTNNLGTPCTVQWFQYSRQLRLETRNTEYDFISATHSTGKSETETARTATVATPSATRAAEAAAAKAVTVLIIGKTGNGKSSVANTLLGRDVFHTGSGLASTTTTAQSAESCVDGTTVKVGQG